MSLPQVGLRNGAVGEGPHIAASHDGIPSFHRPNASAGDTSVACPGVRQIADAVMSSVGTSCQLGRTYGATPAPTSALRPSPRLETLAAGLSISSSQRGAWRLAQARLILPVKMGPSEQLLGRWHPAAPGKLGLCNHSLSLLPPFSRLATQASSTG